MAYSGRTNSGTCSRRVLSSLALNLYLRTHAVCVCVCVFFYYCCCLCVGRGLYIIKDGNSSVCVCVFVYIKMCIHINCISTFLWRIFVGGCGCRLGIGAEGMILRLGCVYSAHKWQTSKVSMLCVWTPWLRTARFRYSVVKFQCPWIEVV